MCVCVWYEEVIFRLIHRIECVDTDLVVVEVEGQWGDHQGVVGEAAGQWGGHPEGAGVGEVGEGEGEGHLEAGEETEVECGLAEWEVSSLLQELQPLTSAPQLNTHTQPSTTEPKEKRTMTLPSAAVAFSLS